MTLLTREMIKIDYEKLASNAGVKVSSAQTLFRNAKRKLDRAVGSDEDAAHGNDGDEEASNEGTPAKKGKGNTQAKKARTTKNPRFRRLLKPHTHLKRQRLLERASPRARLSTLRLQKMKVPAAPTARAQSAPQSLLQRTLRHLEAMEPHRLMHQSRLASSRPTTPRMRQRLWTETPPTSSRPLR